MDYVIIVNDNGELKTVTAAELKTFCDRHETSSAVYAIGYWMGELLNAILDARSAEEREEIDKASAGVL